MKTRIGIIIAGLAVTGILLKLTASQYGTSATLQGEGKLLVAALLVVGAVTLIVRGAVRIASRGKQTGEEATIVGDLKGRIGETSKAPETIDSKS